MNHAPTSIALSASTVAENAAGAIIGDLTVTDPDAGNTHTFAVDDSRFEVVSGQLKLKADSSLDHETAATVNVTVTATDAGGLFKTQAFAITVTDVAETTTLVGTADADTINFPTGLDDFIITGQAGDDAITTSAGNDIIRPGEGADTVNAGAGNDIVVVVGQTAAGQYDQADIDNPGGSGIDLSSVITLADLNGRVTSEVVAGESIDGGAGTNRLVIYGNVDFTGVTLTNVTQFQVNSTLTVSAQQLNALGINLIFGDGESVLNLTNESGDPVTVDLSGVGLSDFKTLNLGPNVTLIVDQADVADLLYLTGSGVLRASDASGTLNLAGKYTTLTIQDKDGTTDASHGGASLVSGDLLIASEAGETLTGGADNDRLLGGDGNDIINGGDGNDILRGGKGVDEMHGGEGDDRFVIVGDLSGGGKIDSLEDTDVLGFPLTTLNGKTFGEDVGGGVIRGGEGNDTLYVFGTANLSDWDIEGVENIEMRSDVTFTKAFFDKNVVKTINGDGSSTVRIISDTPLVLDLDTLEGFKLAGIGAIELGENVTLKISSLDQLGGARILSGTGKIEAKSGSLDLTGYTKTADLKVKNLDGGDAAGAELLDNIISRDADGVYRGTDGDDYFPGTAVADTFISGTGNDVMLGGAGDDKYEINGSGKKTILDTSGKDMLDLSAIKTGGANLNLSDGGTAGSTQIELGSGSGRAAIDLMILQDLSGSFGDDVPTVKALLDSLFAGVRDIHSDSRFGASAFVDKPVSPFGSGSDYVYKTWQTITNDTALVKTAFNNMRVLSGNDGPESQLEALYQVALRTIADDATPATFGDEIGYRPGSMRVVVLTTDANYHVAGHHAGAGPNNGDTILDGTPPGTGEDYPTVAQVKDALAKANIYPIFAVTSGNNATYESLVTQLGRGDVVPLSSNSSNLISSIQTGLTNYKADFIENVIGTDLADELTGNSLNNQIEGGKSDDVLIGLGGNDTLIGGSGTDEVVYSGTSDQYQIVDKGAWYSVIDNVPGRDGEDQLYGVESVRFLDKIQVLSEDVLNQVSIKFSSKGESIWGLTDIDKKFDLIKIDVLDMINEGKPLAWDPDEIGFEHKISPLDFIADSNFSLSELTVGLPLSLKASLGAYDIDYVIESAIELPGSIAAGSRIMVTTKAPATKDKSSYFAVTPPEVSIKLDAELSADLTGSQIYMHIDALGLDPITITKDYEKVSEKATLAELTLGGASFGGREITISDALAEKWMEPKSGEDLTDAKELFGAKNKGDLIDKASGFLSGEDDLTLIQFPPSAVTNKTHLDPFFTVTTQLGAKGEASDSWTLDITDGLFSVDASIGLSDITAKLSVDDIFPATNKLLDGNWKFFEYKTSDGIYSEIFKVDYTLLGLDLEATIKPVINVEFNPSEILLTVSSVDGKYNETKHLGDSFEIDSGLFSGDSVDFITSYQLLGNVHSKLGLEVDLGFDLKALGMDVAYDTTDNPWTLVPDNLSGEFGTEFADDFLVNTLKLPDFLKDADHDPEKYLFDWQEEFSVTDLLKDIADIDTYFDSLSVDIPFAIAATGEAYHLDLV